MTPVQIVYLVVLGACILASGFFSGSETALVGIPREKVHQLEGSSRGRHLADLVSDPDRMLSTLLVANNFVNILGASIATTLFIDLLGEDWGPWAATGVVTAIILVIGEITPKSLATRYPVRFSLAVAPIIWRLSLFLRPVSRIFQAAARVLFRLMRLNPDHNPPGITEDDIRSLALLGEAEGEIKATEREIIHALFHLEDRPVRDVMTPRIDMVTLTAPVTMADVRTAIAATGHSRFPVVDGDLDHLVGVLYAKDLLRLPPDATDADVAALIREPFLVPESKNVMALLSEMRSRRFGFAVVLDEHGGVEGLITAKDLIAELVGELQDEYDPGTPTIVRVGPRQWVADGRVPIEDLEAAIDTAIEDGPYATLGGRYLSIAGRIPRPGESVWDDRFRYTVLRMDRRRIDRIRIEEIGSRAG